MPARWSPAAAGATTESWFLVSVGMGDKIGLGDISFWSYYSFKR